MARRPLATALGLVAAAALGLLAARPTTTSHAAGADMVLRARWAVPRGPTVNLHPYDIAYLDDDMLLITNPHAGEIWAIDGDGRRLRLWGEESTKFWQPTGIDVNHDTRQVLIGDRKWNRFVVLGDDGQRLPSGWQLNLPRLGPDIPEHAALAPDGTVYVLSDYGTAGIPSSYGRPDGQRVWRLGLDGRQLARWYVQPRRLPEPPRPYAQRIALDGQGRVYLALQSMGGCEPQVHRCLPQDLRPTVDVYRFTHTATRGELITVLAGPDDRLPWSGWHDESLSLAALPNKDRLFVGRYDPPHITAYDIATGDRVLYAYAPQPAAIDRVVAVAARPDGGFAALLGVGDNPKLNEPPHGHIIQFAADGAPDSRLVLRAGDDPLFWPAGRIAVDGLGLTHVLNPDAQHVHTLSPGGWALRTVPALSWPVDLAADETGRVALKGSGGRRGHVALLDARGDLAWESDCACDETSALAMHGEIVVTGEALRGVVDGLRLRDGTAMPGLKVLGRDRFWPADLAATDGGLYTLDTGRGEVTLWTGDAAPLDRGPSLLVGPNVVRIAAHPDGRLATLSHDGVIRAYGPAGGLTHTARIADIAGAEDAWPRDLAWTSNGRLHVLDAARPSVLVLEPVPAPTVPTPTPTPAGPPVCRVTGDKTAAPDTVRLGESVTVTLTLAGACPPPPPNTVDLVLALADLSYGTGAEIRDHEQTQALAAKRLVQGLDLDRVHVAVYQEGHGMHVGLSRDAAAVLEAIDAVGQRWPYQLASDWSAHFGLAKAAEHLVVSGRPSARKMIVFSLRRQPVDYPFYEAAAAAARAQGIEIVVVNYDSPVDAALARIAGPAENLIDWRDAATTDVVFHRIGGPAPTGEIRDVTITDTMYRDVQYEPASAMPSAWARGADLVWELAALDSAGRTFTYRIRPQRTGRYPTNHRAVADYTDADGRRRRYVFPVPVIHVVGPTATPSSTPTPTVEGTATPEPTPTPIPEPAFLPLALRERCTTETRRMDVALVIDASTSMRELTAGQRTKLAAAQEAAQAFLDRMWLGAGDQAAIVSFNAVAVTDQVLTADRSALDAALAGIQVAQQTRIDLAVEAALGELVSPRARPASQPVMIVLTDGRANPVGPDAAVARAAEAKAAGVVVFTVGLGDALDVEALRQMATRPAYFYQAPDGEDLAEIYSEIAVEIPCPPGAFWGRR